MSINIININYKNKNNIQILETVLTDWFKNPKELNMVEPRMSYPFNFKKWIELSYKDSNVESFVCKKDKWVIGIGNIKFNNESKKAHIFHIFTDTKHRNQGMATKMLKYLELLAIKREMNKITINIMPKNESAKSLYKKFGFQNVKSKKDNWQRMEKLLA
jgi:ribosomal protein S18 acetylase RimI-like enzyme